MRFTSFQVPKSLTSVLCFLVSYQARQKWPDMSFGWSAGDIVAALEFILEIAGTLKGVGGAVDKYHATTAWLTDLAGLLKRLYQDGVISSDFSHAVFRIRDRVEEFRDDVSKRLGIALGTPLNGAKSSIRRSFKKLEYHFFVEGRVESLKQEIQGPLATVHLHLSADVRDLLST